MIDRMQEFTREQMQRIHDASMRLLGSTGVAFQSDAVVEIFKRHGMKVDGNVVFLQEEDVRKALETAPARFTLHARNPDRNLVVGGDDFVLAPGYGPPWIMTADGEQRHPTMGDYDAFCKLVQTSPHLDMNGYMMIEPSDVPVETAHLDMMFSNIVLCDRVFMGSPVSREGAIDALEMAAIVWGSKETIRERPVMISLINSMSPLQFAEEMSDCLVEFARAGQPCLVAALIMSGASGPITAAGVLTLQNAEILAALTLTQLVNPGAPFVYGSTASSMDMRTGGLTIGAPELSQFISATSQLARFYGLPSRSGGALTDSNFPDMQAGAESAVALTTAVRCGIHFILHACGILGSYIAMSFEKFLIDEELCGMARRMVRPVEVTQEAIGVPTIEKVGIGGHYLAEPLTYELCRTAFFLPTLSNRQDYLTWSKAGRSRIDQRAAGALRARLDSYEKPDIDPGIEHDLAEYVSRRKAATPGD
jgi:trimethylamine--corrinoid protein Co-methyltransferase